MLKNKSLLLLSVASTYSLLAACSSRTATPPASAALPLAPAPRPPLPPPKAIVIESQNEPAVVKQPEEPKHSLKARNFSSQSIQFSIVTFDTRSHELVVDDQPNGPGSEYDRAEDAGTGHLAAINGGFFTPEGAPLGLVVTKQRRRGGINRASFLGTGFFLGPQAQLMSRTEFLKNNPKNSEVLQSGPRLVWSGETLTGLSNQDKRPRSFLLWDGKYHFAIGFADSATLKGLSNALASQPISRFKIAYALNLDGGRSSDLWVSSSVSGGGFSRSSFFNKDVRNYLVLKKR